MTNKAQAGGQVMSDIQETIDRLRELDRYASPAPWEAWDFGEDEQTSIEHPMGDVLERGERGYGHMREDITWLREADADLITETRNALPVLLAEIDRLGTRLAIAEARLGRVAARHPEAYLAAL